MTAPVVAAPARPASPFKGLTPYAEEDAAFFFGRDEEIEVAIANLEARHLTLLYGESGVGKSSLLRAGVVHRLRESARRNLEEIGTPEFVPVYFATWRDDPLAALLEEIRRSVSAVLGEPAHEAPPSGRLDEALELWSTQADADILVVLDQFEEYFVYHSLDRGEGTLAGELPRAVNNPRLRARFLLAIREDGLAKLDRFKREIPSLFGTYLRLRHLDRDSAEEAITRPIKEYNRLATTDEKRVDIEPALVQAVLDQVTAGRVVLEQAGQGLAGGDGVAPGEERIETPYLQLVMTRLWNEEMARSSRLLRLSTLHELGGAETIVRTHLDEALGALPLHVQDVVADLFHYLVTPTGTKIAHRVPDLAAYTGRSEPEVAVVLEQLSGGEARILRPVAAPHGEEGPPRYEIFHDVLGPAVLDWRTRHVHGRLEQQKDQAEKLAHEERRRARIYRALAVGAFALMIAATSVFAVVQTRRADDAKRSSESRQFAAESRDALNGNSLDTAILRAVEAGARADTFEARSALLAVVRRSAGLRRFLHFPSAVDAMAIDPVGGKLAVALRNGTLAVHARDGRALASLHRKSGDVRRIAFDPRGRQLAVATRRGILLATLEPREKSAPPLALKVSRTLQGGSESGYAVAFSSDGRWLAGASGVGTWLWDLRRRSSNPVRSFGAEHTALSFSPTSAGMLVTGDSRGGLALWSVTRPEPLVRRFNGPGSGSVWAVAFSPDGRTLASAGDDKVVRLWRLSGTAKPRPFSGHTTRVQAVAFSPDGSTLAGGGDDGTVIVWNVRTAHRVGEPFRGHGNVVTSLAFDRKRNTLAVASLDGKVSLWNVAERARLGGRAELPSEPADVAFSRDGKQLVALTWDGRVLVRPAANPTRAGRLRFESEAFYDGNALAVSPTGSWLATAGYEGVRLWDPRSAKPRGRLPRAVRAASVTDVTFSSNGMLAAATDEGRILVWKPGGSALTANLGPRTGGRDSGLEAIAFGPDGMLVVAGYWNGSGDGSVVLWPVPRGPGAPQPSVRPTTMPGGHLRPVLAVAISPDGKTLASAGRDFTIKLWSVEEHRLLDTLYGHTNYVTGLAFSPDDTTLASSSEDGTVQLWDVREHRRLGQPLTVGAKVSAVVFRPEGSGAGRGMLAAASTDGVLSFWDASFWSLGTKDDLDALHLRLCRVAGGDVGPKARMGFTADLREACGWT